MERSRRGLLPAPICTYNGSAGGKCLLRAGDPGRNLRVLPSLAANAPPARLLDALRPDGPMQRFLTSVRAGFEMTGCSCVFVIPNPVRRLVMPRILSRGMPQKRSFLLRLGSYPPVIARQCAHWRGNPLSLAATIPNATRGKRATRHLACQRDAREAWPDIFSSGLPVECSLLNRRDATPRLSTRRAGSA